MANGKPSTKTEIFNKIAEDTDLKKKDVAAVFDSLTSIIKSDLISANAFSLPGLLKIKKIHKPAVPEREGINPFTKEMMMFKAKPARDVVKVTPLKGLKEMV
jgi:nucleoid DNA-binding protein